MYYPIAQQRPVAPHLPNYPHGVMDTAAPESHPPSQSISDSQFLGLLNAYRAWGGLARASEVFALFRSRSQSNATTLACAIVERHIICFDWQVTTWIPLFQFRPADMALHPGLEPVLCELRPVLGAWEMANWFVQENGWLAESAPAKMLVSDPTAVLNAARADCIITAYAPPWGKSCRPTTHPICVE